MAVTVYLEKNKIELKDDDYLSAGGQAKLYTQGSLVFKIFDIKPEPDFETKIRELSVLSRPNIVAPQKIVYDKRGSVAGYTMPFVRAGTPLPRLFATGYQQKSGITPVIVAAMLSEMIDTIKHIHLNDILIVDGNEFNYLVDDNRVVHFIDVDSYQTSHFPAKVIMPSIRDWSSPLFSKESDWFSFAVIATQLYMGIHPFRGTWKVEPTLKDIKERMLRRISVFNPDVNVPAATRDPSAIPAAFRSWLSAVFEQGERSVPPLPAAAVSAGIPVQGSKMSGPAAATRITASGTAIDFEIIRDYGEAILNLFFAAGSIIAVTAGKVFKNGTAFERRSDTEQYCVFDSIVAGVDVRDGMLSLRDIENRVVIDAGDFQNGQAHVVDGRLYLLISDALVETKLIDLQGRYRLVQNKRWALSQKSATLLDGLTVADHLGSVFLYLPFAPGKCAIVRAEPLDGHRIIEARFRNGVAMVLSAKDDRYFKTDFRFSKDLGESRDSTQTVVDGTHNPAFLVLNNNTLLEYSDEDSIRLSLLGEPGEKRIGNCGFAKGVMFWTDGAKVYVSEEGRLSRISLK